MSEAGSLRQLYRDTVLEHSRHPHNFRRIAAPEASAEGHNPLCGDRISLFLQIHDGRIDDVAFEAVGCAISLASASMLTDLVSGRTTAGAIALSQDVQAMLDNKPVASELGEITALSGVCAYPSRVRCAALAWRTLEAALGGIDKTVSTESKEP